ncbi:MAG: Fic family protein [Ignavibacteriales bacterium]|nr:Fic family protein [Ignavibacteriales bacterium]
MSELLFANSNPQEAYKIKKKLLNGEIRKIAPKIYTSNFDESPADIIARNIFEILGALYPGAVLSHRTAFEFKLTSSGQIFVTHSYTKKIKLPGVTINFLEGEKPVRGDNKLFAELYVSSRERAFLENLQITKKSGSDAKTLSHIQIEERLESILKANGESALNNLRDKAREVSLVLDMGREFEILNKIIGALLATKSSESLQSELGISRAAGLPFDKYRIELFENLFEYLYSNDFKLIAENNLSQRSFRNFAFFEAYFSNYIEGTVFEIAEAKEIVDSGIALPSRDSDSHDVLGTYRVVSDRNEMKHVPATGDELLVLLQARHKILLSSRVQKHPGEFKSINNRAGNTEFVDFKLVRGTLKRGFEYYKALVNPFSRAAYIMFLVSEVHPFEDGNGRIARVMMNAELVAGGQCKIIIPTVYREDYLLTLKKLTNGKMPAPYVTMLSKAHKFSSHLNHQQYNDLLLDLKNHNAFCEPTEGKLLTMD